MSWIDVAGAEGVPTIPVLGASMMGRTTQGSPSMAVLPQEEGGVLSYIASVKSAQFFSGSRSGRLDASGMDVSSAALSSAVVTFPHKVLLVDATSNLHPFFIRLDTGPIRLATIAHAFNYRVAVLRDGVRMAVRVGRSRKAEGRILEDTDVSWGHQVAVRFQIVSVLALEVPAFLQNIENLQAVSPDVHLSCKPWGHVDHCSGDCECLSSDRMGAYVHDLALMPLEYLSVTDLEDASVHTGGSGVWKSHVSGIGAERPRSLPFVSQRPGTYGRMLLAVYVWWKTGLLVTSDWLRPVTRGGGLEGGPTGPSVQCG